MLTGTGAGPIADIKTMSLPSPAKRGTPLRDAMTLRIAALATCIFAMSNLTRAQDADTSATATADSDPATVSLEEKHAALEKVNMELEERVLELEKVNRDLEARAIQLKQTLLVANTAGRRLSSNLARRISRNVSRHVSTMAGTSIPYIGVGVLAAMTELDVRDSCESLRELNEMNRAMGLEREDDSRVCAMQVPAKEQVVAQVINNWRTAYGNAAAWANQYEAMLPPEPPGVAYPHAGELWMAVFGATPKPALQSLPMLPNLPALPAMPSLPTLPTMKRPSN